MTNDESNSGSSLNLYQYDYRYSEVSLIYRPSSETVHKNKPLFKIALGAPISDLDMTDILNDVFIDYLKPNELVRDSRSDNNLEEDVDTYFTPLTGKKTGHAGQLVDYSRLDEVLKFTTPSQIKTELMDKFRNLKKKELIYQKMKSIKKCSHLPQGFISEEIQQICLPCKMPEKIPHIVVSKVFLLSIEPPEIVFSKYKIGTIYKRHCLLRNKGKSLIKGRLGQVTSPEFELIQSGEVFLPSGLTFKVTVVFTPTILASVIGEFPFHIINNTSEEQIVYKIPVIANRASPMLIGFKSHTEEEVANGESDIKFIDCGFNLIGRNCIKNITLTNAGSLTTFILSTNMDKIYSDESVENIKLEHFELSPCKFTLDNKESVLLQISFCPQTEGKCWDNIKVICDNGTVDFFDIIGEGVAVDRKLIQFNKLDKNFPVVIEDDMNAEYVIDLQKCYPTGKVFQHFHLKNKCILPLDFHWETRIADVKSEYINIPEESIRVTPHCGTFSKLSKMNFFISCSTINAEPNFYKSVLRFVLDDLPEKCIKEDCKQFIIPPSLEDQQDVSLNAGEIEMWVEVVLPEIQIIPNIIQITSCDYQPVRVELTVKNLSFDGIKVYWQWKKKQLNPDELLYLLSVYPEESEIGALEEKNFILQLNFYPKAYKNVCLTDEIRETFACWVNGDEVFVELYIIANVRRNDYQAKDVSSNRSDTKDLTPHKDLIHLNPVCREELLEIYKDKMDAIMKKGKCISKFALNQISDLVNTTMATRINDSGLVCGVTIWDEGVDVAWIIGDVRSSEVSIEPMLLVVLLYHEYHDKSSLTMYNRSLVPAKYRWEKPTGSDADMLDIWVTNAIGVIAPMEIVEFDLYLYPRQYGKLRDLHLPCYIDDQTAPILVDITGTVQPLRVMLQWETEKGLYQIPWGGSDTCVNQLRGYEISPSDTWLHDKVSCSESVTKLLNDLQDGHFNCKYDSSDESFKIKSCIKLNDDEVSLTRFNPSPSLRSENFEALIDNYLLFSSSYGQLGCVINNTLDFKRYEKSMVFKTRVGISQSKVITLKNITPITTSLSIGPEIFFSDTDPPEYPPYISHINSTISDLCPVWKYRNEGKERKIGLFLEVRPSDQELKSFQEAKVQVTAHSDVWGEYIDLLIIDIAGLPSYAVPISVKTTGLPVSFTFDPRPDPIFRFGTLTPLEISEQVITVRNNSYVPLKIAWTVYSKPFQPKMETLKRESSEDNQFEPPFSLAVDIHNPKHENFCEIALIDYIGYQANNPIKVEPGITYIDSYREHKMNIRLEVPDVKEEGIIEATCIGLIYIDPFLREEWKSLSYRPTGLSTDFIKLKLICNVQVPSINFINCETENFCFKINVTYVMEKGQYEIDRKFLLKNMSKALTYVDLSVENPFRITSIQTRDLKPINVANDNTFIMKPHQIIMITVVITVTKNYILDNDSCLTSGPDSNDVVTTTEKSIFKINQPKLNEIKEVGFNFSLIYPTLRFSSKRIVFGPVLVNEIKVKVFRITAISGRESFKIDFGGTHFQEGYSPFSFTPSQGVIKRGQYVEIKVSFQPSESTGYLDELFIKTSVPNWTTDIVLEGVGTWNYKFHQIVDQ